MPLKITGTIASGLGEGAHFLSMPHYKQEIEDKLGFLPFPGTLNIKPIDFDKDLLKRLNCEKISGFEKDGRKFGGATCFRASIKNIKGAIIIPDINKHKDVIEFISSKRIRSELKLNDGDQIIIELK